VSYTALDPLKKAEYGSIRQLGGISKRTELEHVNFELYAHYFHCR